MSYVLCWCERLRDGREYGSQVFPTVEAALAKAADYKQNAFNAHNLEFQLFELGKEIPLVEEVVVELGPPVKRHTFRVG